MGFRTWLEEEEGEEEELRYRFGTMSDAEKSAYEQKLSQKWRQEDEKRRQQAMQQVTLDSPIKCLNLSGGFGMEANSLITHLELWRQPLREVIKITYDRMKKAAWEIICDEHGFPTWSSARNYLGTQEFDKMGFEEKKVWLHNRMCGELRNAIYSLTRCLHRQHTDIGSKSITLAPLPEPVIKWLNYLQEEVDHDSDIVAYMDRFEADLKTQDERWATQAKKQEEDAQRLADALYKARKRLPYWSDATNQDALKTARDFIKADPHERGQFSQAIREIARKTLQKRLPTKSYYMEPEEAKQFISQNANIDLSKAHDRKVAEILNKTIGITDSQDLMGNDWGEHVHPALSAGDLGPAAGLRIQAGAELKKRLQGGNDQMIRDIFYALDAENRPLFFKQ